MARGGDEAQAPSLSAKVHEAVKRLPRFPGDCPGLHQGKQWAEALDDEIRALRLQPILSNQLPLRVQHLRNWPDELCEVSDEILDTVDEAIAYKIKVEAAGRAKENERNDELIRIAVLEDQNDLFTLISESMTETAKLLRDELFRVCKIPGSEFYHGGRAREHTMNYLTQIALETGGAKPYQIAEENLRKPENRLPKGCSPRQFATRVRVFTHIIQPNLARPYVGEDAGAYILDLMPADYLEAATSLKRELKKDGKLHDQQAVIRACRRRHDRQLRQRRQSRPQGSRDPYHI